MSISEKISRKKKRQNGNPYSSTASVVKQETTSEEINEIYLKFTCEVCNEKLESSSAFALHSNKHSKDKKYHCHHCRFKSTLAKKISNHMKWQHGGTGKFFQCDICVGVFPESIQAIEHKNFHSGEMPFKCEACQKHFMFSWLLNTHQRLFHSYELFCDICNSLFRTKSGLRKHKFRKHNKIQQEQPLCDICGKTLASSETLKYHKRTHTGEKPHTCLTCGKSFVKKGLLIEHERIHTGEKPFPCMFCGKSFSQRASLKIHTRIHTGERPYVCKFCGKGCICKSVLDSHLKNCSGVHMIANEATENELIPFQ